jgi:endo-beta-N-acetylglucosaminidase D
VHQQSKVYQTEEQTFLSNFLSHHYSHQSVVNDSSQSREDGAATKSYASLTSIETVKKKSTKQRRRNSYAAMSLLNKNGNDLTKL